MLKVLKGMLIECDPAMKQFLLYLDESNALGKCSSFNTLMTHMSLSLRSWLMSSRNE
ncbi:General transcription factor IIH subunit 5 [Lemmus lemmus]